VAFDGGPRGRGGRVVSAGLTHLQVEVEGFGERAEVRLGFGGRFNLQNLLAPLALARVAGVGLAAAAAGLEGLGPPAGRFEVLEKGGGHAMVDYAHSANALEALLASCRELVEGGRLLVVFGCGGDKDRAKRPRMGAAAARVADRVWITNDNPRGADPGAIAAEVLGGVPGGSHERVEVELDRGRAIRAALDAARPGDLVVVAGKGHETTQTTGGVTRPFDDREEIRRHWEGTA